MRSFGGYGRQTPNVYGAMKPQHWKLIAAVALLALAVLAVTGSVDLLIGKLGFARLHRQNTEYLERSFDRSVRGFVVLSTIKAGLAIIEGSDVELGFSLGAKGSFELQYGDAVQSIYDFVDVAWKTSLAGGAVLLLTRLLLNTACQVDQWFMAVAIAALFICHVVDSFAPRARWISRVSGQLFALFVVLSATLYLVLPLTIRAASFLSNAITAPLVEEAMQGYESVRDDLSSEALVKRLSPTDANASDSILDRLKVSKQIEKLRRRYELTVKWLESKMEDMAVWTIKLFAGYLFDCVLFPAVIFFVFFVGIRGLLSYAFGMRRDKSFREDLVQALRNYYHPRQPAADGQDRSTPPDAL